MTTKAPIALAEFVTLPQLAERLGVSRVSISRWVEQGALPRPLRIGRRIVRWRVADLNAWFAEQQQHQNGVVRHDTIEQPA